jgi:hypothetical protein
LQSLEGEDTIVALEDGDYIVPSKNHVYELFLADSNSTGTFTINITDSTDSALHYALFLPANPSQVEVEGVHFLVDAEGKEVYPESVEVLEAESASSSAESEEGSGEKPWGKVIGSTLLVNLITLIGVIFLIPAITTALKDKTLSQCLKDMVSKNHVFWEASASKTMFDICITAFACGALLATTVFLIIPEAFSLVNAGPPEEGEDPHAGHRMLQDDHSEHEGEEGESKVWVFGTCILGGFLLPMFLASFFPHHTHTHQHAAVPSDETSGK